MITKENEKNNALICSELSTNGRNKKIGKTTSPLTVNQRVLGSSPRGGARSLALCEAFFCALERQML